MPPRSGGRYPAQSRRATIGSRQIPSRDRRTKKKPQDRGRATGRRVATRERSREGTRQCFASRSGGSLRDSRCEVLLSAPLALRFFKRERGIKVKKRMECQLVRLHEKCLPKERRICHRRLHACGGGAYHPTRPRHDSI